MGMLPTFSMPKAPPAAVRDIVNLTPGREIDFRCGGLYGTGVIELISDETSLNSQGEMHKTLRLSITTCVGPFGTEGQARALLPLHRPQEAVLTENCQPEAALPQPEPPMEFDLSKEEDPVMPGDLP